MTDLIEHADSRVCRPRDRDDGGVTWARRPRSDAAWPAPWAGRGP